MEQPNEKYIQLLKIKCHRDYSPPKYFSVYEFMRLFIQAIKERYDIEVIEVRYKVSRTKFVREFDDISTNQDLKIDRNYNNVFAANEPFMINFIMDKLEILKPESDFDSNKFDEQNQKELQKEEEAFLKQISTAIDLLMKVYLLDEEKLKEEKLISLDKFKVEPDRSLTESDVDVYLKVILNKTVHDLIDRQKNQKNPVVIKDDKSGKSVNAFLHPDARWKPQYLSNIVQLLPISDWKLGSHLKNQNQSYLYFDSETLQNKAQRQNMSIKIYNRIALKRNNRYAFSDIEVYSFLFNQIVLKIVVNVAQIAKIERYEDSVNIDYYIFLTYPAKYYLTILKKDVACDDRFLWGWERVENFSFLRHNIIKNNDFLRLFLFNNTILTLKIKKTDLLDRGQGAKKAMQRLIQSYGGSIPCKSVEDMLSFKYTIKFLANNFNHNAFLRKMKYNIGEQSDKLQDKTVQTLEHRIWKIKYLLLVMIRNNYMNPIQATQLLEEIESRLTDLDIFLYILWKIAISTWGYKDSDKITFVQYVLKEYDDVKKLNIQSITRKISSNTEFIAYVFKASLTPSGYIYDPPTPEMKGRLLKEMSDCSQFFIRVRISDENQGSLRCRKYMTKHAFRSMMNEINILDRVYKPLGWSPSQLRAFSLWYVYETKLQQKLLSIEYIRSFLGDFSKIQNAAKKAARIGQSFSASWSYNAKEIKKKQIPDVFTPKKHCFTDGIGKISKELLDKISLKLGVRDLSIIQIRYLGAKGVLVLDSDLPPNVVQLRPSMIKYQCIHDAAQKYLDILDWNRYKPGFLNRQIIILLRTLGIRDSVFEKLQNEHIQNISSMSFKDCSIFKHLQDDAADDIGNLEPANVTILHLLRAGFSLQQEPFFRGVLETMKKNGYHQLKIKSKIMISKSARIIGIIDQYGVLEDGEIYCTIFDPFSINPFRETIEGDVIVTRNPCLHPADIRKLKCVGFTQISDRFARLGRKENQFKELINCVIFPMKGQIPVTAQISGSDLDGDCFFISWQRSLIPEKHEEAYMIDDPNQKKKPVDKKIESETPAQADARMLNFFIDYLNYEKLGQIDNSHLVHADRNGIDFARDKHCIELAKIHGKAVDFPKTGECPQFDHRLLVSQYPDFIVKESIQNLLEDADLVHEVHISKELVKEIDINFSDKMVIEAFKQLKEYEKDIKGIISLVGVDTEFEIYSGNFTIAKENVKAFGKNRVLAVTRQIRFKHFDKFFEGLPLNDLDAYKEGHEKVLNNEEFFSRETLDKCIFYYLVSYIMKFPNVKFEEPVEKKSAFEKLKKQVDNTSKLLGYFKPENNYFGFVWFVVPKIMISQKVRSRQQTEREANKQIPQQRLQLNANQHDSEQDNNDKQANYNSDGQEVI